MMWADELARQRHNELLDQAAEARLAREFSRRGGRRLRLRGRMAAALHRAANRLEPASLPVHREPC